MLNLLRHYKASPASLLSSSLYDEQTFYKAFIKDLKYCQEEIIIESPFMTARRVNMLLPVVKKLVKHGVRVTINTRHPKYHDKSLIAQAWVAMESLKSIGVSVRLFNDLRHRKVAVIDNRILWEGSLNILSQHNSREIMRRIESEELIKQVVRFLQLKLFYY